MAHHAHDEPEKAGAMTPDGEPAAPHRRVLRSERIGAQTIGSRTVGGTALGALAVGALAVGALAIGALAIGRLKIGRARIARLEVDEFVVGNLRVTGQLDLPDQGTLRK